MTITTAIAAKGIVMSDTKEILASATDTVKQPLPLEESLPAVEPFKDDMLPDALMGYVRDVSDRTQSPIEYSAVASIVVVATVVGAKFAISPKRNDNWIVAPNLWGTLIGPPSAMKSPPLKEAIRPVIALEKENLDFVQEQMDEQKLIAELSKSLEKEVWQEAEALFKEGLREEALEKIRSAKPEAPTFESKRYIVNDATVEKLGELLNENPNGMLLLRDELSGFLSKLSREDAQLDRAFYLECFDGFGRFTYDRIGRGTIVIENTMMSLLGGIQPSKISILVRQAMRGNADDGLIQRLQLAVWPDPTSNWEWRDRAPSASAYESYRDVLKGFHSMPIPEEPAVLQFDVPAQEMFAKWMTDLQVDINDVENPSVVQSHLAKMPKTIATLALLFELINGGNCFVSAKSLAMALRWFPFLKSHANRLYSVTFASSIGNAKRILKRRDKLNDSFTARDVRRKGWAGLTEKVDVLEALDCLVEHHYLIEIQPTSGPAGGRPSMHYRWSPVVDSGPPKASNSDTPKPPKRGCPPPPLKG